ncbi:hypothetical protein PENSPDRAFT_751513 [Peniophora sp. CONT]|nr:hypothetical protein PENSPDRAFT_751513 [Peniophora sp. CONT]
MTALPNEDDGTMVYDVTPDGGVARFNEWLETQLASSSRSASTAPPLPETLQRSLATIDELQRSLLEAKEAYNRQVPILQLPVELLAEIFLYARDAWPSIRPKYAYHDGIYNYYHSWMRIGEVCRRFRDVAGDPNLWTCLSSDASPTWAYLTMVALPNANISEKPIALSLRLGSRGMKPVEDFRGRLYTPVRELRLHGTIHYELPVYVRNILTYRDMGSLRALHLDLVDDDGAHIHWNLDYDCFPSGLRELSWVGSLFTLRSSYDHLERLTLSVIKIAQRSDAENLQVLLKRIKSLKFLKLDRLRIIPDAAVPFKLPPNLQSFEFATVSSFIFMQNLSPTRQVSLSIQRTAPPRDNEDEQVFETIASQWLGSDIRPTAANIYISYNTVALDAELRFWRFISSALAQSHPDVAIRRYIDESYTLLELLRGVCLIDMADLELNIDCVTMDDFTGQLKDLMDAMPNLHMLRLTESCLANVFRTPGDTDGLRQLRTLYVRQGSIYRTVEEYVKEEVQALALWLQYRKDTAYPVHTLFVPSRVARALDEEGFTGWQSLAFVTRIT